MLNEGYQDLEAKIVRENIQVELEYRLNVLGQAIGVDNIAAAELAGFTQLAVEEAAIKYGLDIAEVQNIRDMFSDVGAMLMAVV